jgi:integrase
MLKNSCCTDPDTAISSDRRYFRNFRILHSSQRLHEGARPEVVRDNMGHANIDVTQNVYARAGGKSEWMQSPELSKP